MEESFSRNEPILNKPKLQINREVDAVLAQHSVSSDEDRSIWLKSLLSQHPDIKTLREIVNPLVRASKFARLYLPANRMLPNEIMFSLISQHLRTLGLVETQASMHGELIANVVTPPHRLNSQLSLLIQRSVYKTERFWELIKPSMHSMDSKKQTQTALDAEISKTIGSTPSEVKDESPIINETKGNPDFMKKEGDELVEASLNQLIYYITDSTNEDIKDLSAALCLTISSYCSSKVFLTKIQDRIRQSLPESKESVFLAIKLLDQWIQGALNYLEPQVIEKAKVFVEKELSTYSRFFEHTFEEKQERRTAQSTQKLPPVELGKIENLWMGEFDLTDLPPAELARQLTIWSYMRYYSIKRTELLNCAWEKPRLKHRAPNVIALSSHFNKISQWTAYEILSCKRVSDRIAKIEYFIEVARILFEMRNFFDTVGILGGFDSNAIFRLKVHLSLISSSSKDSLSKLKTECSTEKNFLNLRNHYDSALKNRIPALPYIGVLLSDLFKYDEATQLFVNGLINVRKVKKVYQMISKIEEFMQSKYMFLSVDQVQEKLDQLKNIDEDESIERSILIEKDGSLSESDLLNE